jgi:hypothetical protein
VPDRTRLITKGAVAVLLILLAAAGTRASWPSVSVSWPGAARFAVTAGVLEVILAGLLIALRWPRSRQTAAGATGATGAVPKEDLPARMRRILNAALITALVGLPVLVALSELKVLKAHRILRPLPKAKLRGHLPLPRTTPSGNFHLWPLLLYVIVAVLIAALILLALRVRRYGRRRPKLTEVGDFDTELTEGELARAVESGQAALLEFSDARLAIIRCYVAMEHSFADAGTVRGDAETPDELLVRAVTAGLVPPRPASLLTSLFYEARFSTHPMPPAKRELASGALGELAAGLAAAPATPTSPAG